MDEGQNARSALQDEVLRGQEMKTPDDVAAMLRLKACGWGIKRIARELGCSHHTVKHDVAAGGVKPFKSPQRPKLLDGHEVWLRERFIRHRGTADVVRQELAAEKGLAAGRRTQGGGAGDRAVRDGAGPAAADRLRRAARRDRGAGEGVRVGSASLRPATGGANLQHQS